MVRKIKRTRIETDGHPIPGLPFMGEMMVCVMCGKSQQSDPRVESQWRAVILDGTRFYACPDEFPPDEPGTREAFRDAYIKIVERCVAIMRRQN